MKDQNLLSIIVISILSVILIMTTSCKKNTNGSSSNETGKVKNGEWCNDKSQLLHLFSSIDNALNVSWKKYDSSAETSSLLPTQKEPSMVGYIFIDDEFSNAIMRDYSLAPPRRKTNIVAYPDTLSHALNLLASRKLTADYMPSGWAGNIYFDQQNKLLYFNIFK